MYKKYLKRLVISSSKLVGFIFNICSIIFCWIFTIFRLHYSQQIISDLLLYIPEPAHPAELFGNIVCMMYYICGS